MTSAKTVQHVISDLLQLRHGSRRLILGLRTITDEILR